MLRSDSLQAVGRLAEIGLDDDLVVANLLGRSLRDLPSLIEDDDVVGDVHDHPHVVLDEDDDGIRHLHHVEHVAADRLLLLEVHAPHRLVEEEDLGIGGEGAAELHPFLETEREAPGRSGADLGDVEEVDDLLRPPPMLDFLAAGRAPEDAALEHPALHEHAAAEEDVVEHRHPCEEGDVLERAGDPVPGHLEGPAARDVGSVEQHSPGVRGIDPAHHVDEGGLAGSVGPDDGKDLPRLRGQGRFAQGEDAAERLRRIDDFKTIAHPFRPESAGKGCPDAGPGGGSFYRASCWRVKHLPDQARSSGGDGGLPKPVTRRVWNRADDCAQSIALLITYKAQVRTRGSREHEVLGARASRPRAVHAGKVPALPGRRRPQPELHAQSG